MKKYFLDVALLASWLLIPATRLPAAWVPVGNQNVWTIRDGIITGSSNAPYHSMHWLATDERYSDFEVSLEYRLSSGGNSGILLRKKDSLTRGGYEDGIEIQLLDDAAPRYSKTPAAARNGAIHGVSPPIHHVPTPAGRWHSMQVRAHGRRIQVQVNGIEIQDVHLDRFSHLFAKQPGLTRRDGHVGLQWHAGDVRFRNIVVKHLDRSRPIARLASKISDWRYLFGGENSLDSWSPVGRQEIWRTHNSVLRAEGGRAQRGLEWLATKNRFAEFELEFQYRLAPGGNSGVFVYMPREPGTTAADGIEIQLLDDGVSRFRGLNPLYKNGALHAVVGPARQVDTPTKYFHSMRIRIENRNLTVSVNSLEVLRTNLDDCSRRNPTRPGLKRVGGSIGLQYSGSPVEFQSVRIRRL